MHAQVIEEAECVRLHEGRPLEAVITEKLRHPNLVAALGYATVPGRDPYNPHDETWLLLDYCDRGSLIVRRTHWSLRDGGKTGVCPSTFPVLPCRRSRTSKPRA